MQWNFASNIIGYMSAINREEYEGIMGEIRDLEEYLAQADQGSDPPLPNGLESHLDVKARLQDLKEKAYSINDHVGKSGVEVRSRKNWVNHPLMSLISIIYLKMV